MKTKFSKSCAAGAMAAILCLAGGTGFIAHAQDQPPPPAGNTAPPDSSALPPNVDPSSSLAQVIKLIQAGVSEDVVMAYVTNSPGAFNLNPDEIIYLKDIGAPDELVTAMIQRDQALTQPGYQPPPQPAPATATTYVAPPPTVVTVDYFYSTLEPYGSWVDVEGYGRCWRPTVTVAGAGWQPYCDHGHWVWTDDGWYWISDYSWGWAPFHYGRWFHHARFGWCWYPDTVWGPSWVTWRYGDDYCGWAPLPPRCDYREGVGFFYNGAAVSVGFDFGLGVGAFTFVHTRDFCDPHPRRHRVEPREVAQVFNRTTVINRFDVDRPNRTFINRGIDPQHITEATHAPIHPVAIRDTTGPVARGEQLGRDGRTLFVNRPHFSGNPPPSGDRGNPPRTAPVARPAVGSPYQPANNRGNDNSSPARRNQPTAPPPVQPQPSRPATTGSPYQPPNNNNRRNEQPQPQASRAGDVGSPNRNGPTPPIAHPSPPAPVQPAVPNNNFNNSTDNRRYPSPHMQQTEPQNPRMNPGNSGGRVGAPVAPQAPAAPPAANRFSPPAQPPQRNYGAPVTAPSPPARQPEANHFSPPAQPAAPAPPPQRSYVSPRNQTPPSESRPNYSQPQAQGNQSHGGSAPTGQSQNSGRGRNQNGQP